MFCFGVGGVGGCCCGTEKKRTRQKRVGSGPGALPGPRRRAGHRMQRRIFGEFGGCFAPSFPRGRQPTVLPQQSPVHAEAPSPAMAVRHPYCGWSRSFPRDRGETHSAQTGPALVAQAHGAREGGTFLGGPPLAVAPCIFLGVPQPSVVFRKSQVVVQSGITQCCRKHQAWHGGVRASSRPADTFRLSDDITPLTYDDHSQWVSAPHNSRLVSPMRVRAK